jgi:glycosyltransferase involved in cell wall biosynthesis
MNSRVVILTTYYRPIVGGVESNAERLARYLLTAGFDVRVVTKRVTRSLADVEELDGVRIARIGPFGERSAAGKWRLLPSAVVWLLRNRANYDVVCCVDYRGVGIAAIVARSLTDRPVVLQAQTPGGLVPTFIRWPAIALYRRADAVACISHALEREARGAGVPDDRIYFLPNAVDLTRFRPPGSDERAELRRQLSLAPADVVCLFIGRLSREKGLMDLLEAWRIASPRAILLVGGPDMDSHPWNVGPVAREYVERHTLSDSVRFLGSVSDVPSLLRAVDVVVQPSHFEALGLSAVEALASGVPVVASAVGGLLDFVIDGDNGMLCPPQDPSALASRLRSIVDDGTLRRRLSGRARRSVAEYDERIVFAHFAALIRQLARLHPQAT